MATKTVVELVDDLDGTPIAEGRGATIRFAVSGVEYEMDLGEDNAAAFHEVMDDYVKVARKVGRLRAKKTGSRGGAAPAGADRGREQNRAIRDWARSQGLQVNERGRVREDVVRTYEAAH